VSPGTVYNGGAATLAIQGGKLAQDMTYRIVDRNGTKHAATAVYVVNSALVYATFDMANLPTGAYAVEIGDGNLSATLADAFTVVQATNVGHYGASSYVKCSLVAPSKVRAGRTCEIVVAYENLSTSDAMAPILTLSGEGVSFELPAQSSFTADEIGLLAGSDIGPGGNTSPRLSYESHLEIARILLRPPRLPTML